MTDDGGNKQNNNARNIKRLEGVPSEQNFTDEALRAYQKGDILRAKHILNRAIKILPESSFALGFLATIEKALGFEERALMLFEKSVLIDNSRPDILHNYSGLLEDKDLEKALEISNRAIMIAPTNSMYLERNGYLRWKSGDLLGALQISTKAIDRNPNLIDTHINIGGIQKDLGNLDQALTSTLKSLELKPDNPTAHMNLGGIYKDLGNLDQALNSTLKSLELKPDEPAALMNLGGIYKDLGNLDQALASTLQSLELKPDNPTAHMNLGMIYETLNELNSALVSYEQSASLLIQYKEESSLISLVNISIILLQMNRLDDAKTALANTVLRKKISLKPGSLKNRKNMNVYLSYLNKLITKIPNIDSSAESQILHIGESHCLAFTNQTIDLKGKKCILKPSLIKGAKAFHLSEESRKNPQKIGFQKRIQQNLEDYEHIFLSFGEIDSREDEGILPHCKKTGKAIQDVSKSTAIKYFRWTTKSLSRQKEKLVYFGTPAPFILDPISDESSEINKQRLLAIKTFNTTLAKQCQESGVLFADVYQLTARNDGYNSNIWMLDTRHLKPKALQELFKNIKY